MLRNSLHLLLFPSAVFSTVIGTPRATGCTSGALPPPTLFGGSILSINAVEATLPSSSTKFCNVSISYTHPGQNDLINVWLGLPSNWNGRFQGVGGGGWTTGDPLRLTTAIAQGYASVSTDGGHSATAQTASWALLSPGNVNLYALQNFASVTLNDMTVLGKQLTEAYYGEKISKSYWSGCSTGGRQGLMMAQRYPEAYDGILSEAPAINWGQFIPAEFWPQRVMHEAGYFPSQCELNAITAAAIDACDDLDGLKDGVVGLTGLCDFQASSVVGTPYSCPGASPGTISEKAAAIVQSIWKGARDSEGNFQWYGLTPGSPLNGLANTNTTSDGKSIGLPFPISKDWHQIFLQGNTSFDPYSYTPAGWDASFHASGNRYDSIIGTRDADLSEFKGFGGKMITWHGMSDQLIFFNGTVDYWNRVVHLDPNATDFYRFYSAPGVQHCRGGSGAAPTDALAALVLWVEGNEVPETLAANRTVNGTNWTQELCLYPLSSIYKGGDPSQASSFRCE
ncbi:tannase and feruloyl esterase [Pyrenochaeta sp. DS3sAY3a]|nr:tannase and feruloyl esterase [Pyrenochaeta sp. DS3sAY3a]